MELMFSIRRLCFIVVAIFGVVVLYKKLGSPVVLDGEPFPRAGRPNSKPAQSAWTPTSQHPINPSLDEGDGFTPAQCDAAFPDLYKDIDRAKSYWQKQGHTISKQDVEFHSWREWDGLNKGGGSVRFLIHENELRILEAYGTWGHMGYRGRGVGFLYILQRAIDAATAVGEKLPTMEASMILQDIADPPPETTHSYWAWAYNIHNETHQREWLMPNYDFWYGAPMGSYREVRRRARQFDKPFAEKIQKVVWRGSGWTAPDLRLPLAELAKDKEWADIVIADWGGGDSPDGLDIEELCAYAMTVYTEGISFSGRLKYLLACDSLPIIHDLDWMTFDSHLLVDSGPHQNYVRVKRDWSDFEEKVQYYLANPAESERIIRNSHATFHNGAYSRAAISCYIRKLIHAYSSVSFEPEIFRPVKQGKVVKTRRGISIERFWDSPMDDDYESDRYK